MARVSHRAGSLRMLDASCQAGAVTVATRTQTPGPLAQKVPHMRAAAKLPGEQSAFQPTPKPARDRARDAKLPSQMTGGSTARAAAGRRRSGPETAPR